MPQTQQSCSGTDFRIPSPGPVLALHRSKGVLLVACVFAFPAIAGRWASYAVHGDWLFILSHCFGFLFLAFIGGAILLNILRPARVTGDIVNGAVCVYMLVGLHIVHSRQDDESR